MFDVVPFPTSLSADPMTPRVVFFAPPSLTPLDLIGPLQVFHAVESVGGPAYQIEVCGLTKSLPLAGNLHLSNLVSYREIELGPDDILIMTGFSSDPAQALQFLKKHRPLFAWIRRCWETGATICSVCTGSHLLAEAGILDGAACATHWSAVDDLQRRYPKIEVRRGILFVQSGNILTSAGVASGIDLAIHLLSLRHGPKLAFEVSRFLVIYLRRSGEFEQESVYLQFRNHLDDIVHRAQSILIEKLDRPPSLELLAEQVGSSTRNLSRRFRRTLGFSVGTYLQELRLERAHTLLREKGSKVDDIAKACGFSGPRQLRNLYQRRFGRSPRNRAHTVRAVAG
jgi:transcriptional regulator GlxA family with amidase domain